MNGKLSVFLLILFFDFASAQSDSSAHKRRIGFYSHVSVTNGNFSEVNEVFSLAGYPELRNSYGGPTFGISLSNKRNNSYSFVAVSILASNPTSSFVVGASKYSKFRSWEIQVGRTFDLIKSPKWLIYPFLGEGFGYGELTLYDNLGQQSFANSVANLNTPTRKTWSSFYIQWNGGVGIERRVRVGANYFFFGATTGYRLVLSRFTEDSPVGITAPLTISGLEWQIKTRFEISKISYSKNHQLKREWIRMFLAWLN